MIKDPINPLMPMLRALRRNKLRVHLFGESARVWMGKDETTAVEAYDLVISYARGELEVGELIERLFQRLGREPGQ
jgi:hypothetical protein